jgi:hypothetical protein
MQFVLEIFEIFCRDTLYMYLEGELFFTQILFLVQELCPKNKILVNFGQLGTRRKTRINDYATTTKTIHND